MRYGHTKSPKTPKNWDKNCLKTTELGQNCLKITVLNEQGLSQNNLFWKKNTLGQALAKSST